MSGYSIIKDIENNTNHRPSPGSIYPILKSLLKERKVTVKKEDRKKIYSLTEDGKSCLFKWIPYEIIETEKLMFTLTEKDLNEKEKSQIQEIMKETNRKLRKIL